MCQRHHKASHFKIDAFHTVNLGVGKVFAASSLCFLSDLCSGNTIDERLADMTSCYLEYCKDSGAHFAQLWFPYNL